MKSSDRLLQDLVQRESRSLLQYVSESDPWTTQRGRRELVKALAAEEQQALGKIARHLRQRHLLSALPDGYPSNFTTMNFVALEHLLPFLVEYVEKSIQALEQQLGTIADEPARSLLTEYLDMKRRHLQALTSPAVAAAPAHHG